MSDQAKTPETDEEAARKAANILVYTDEFLNRPKFPDAREKSAALVGFLAGVKRGESKAQQRIAELEADGIRLGTEIARQSERAMNNEHRADIIQQKLTAERAHSDMLAEALETLAMGHGVPLAAAMVAPPERYRIMAKALNEELQERAGVAREALAAHKLRRASHANGVSLMAKFLGEK